MEKGKEFHSEIVSGKKRTEMNQNVHKVDSTNQFYHYEQGSLTGKQLVENWETQKTH